MKASWRGEYLDLIRHFENQDTSSPDRRVVVWEYEEDSRRALYLRPGARASIPLPDHLENCTLHFAIALPPAAHQEDRRGGSVAQVKLTSSVREEVVFREVLTTSTETPRWAEHEIELPRTVDGLSVVLETGPPADGTGDHFATGYAQPHVVCDRSTRGGTPGRVVVLVSVDTLRADHLEVYGYDRPTAPHLAALAEDSLVFNRAFAPSPFTLPSHASMLTGLAPEEHRAGYDFPESALPENVPTLAGWMSDAGYRTVGISAGGLMSDRFGVAQGFQEWHQYTRGNLPSVLPLVFDALDDGEAPTFLFLHTYDVHGPYQQPAGHRYFQDSEPSTPTVVAEGTAEKADHGGGDQEEWQRILNTRYHGYQELDRFSSVREVVDTYDSGIRFVDSQLGLLFDFLRRRGLYQDALIVVTSDHGESLYDQRRYFGHSHALTDAELRVPLLVKLPRDAQGDTSGRRDDLVELSDLPPLILETVGLTVPEGLRGRNPLTADAPRLTVRGASTHLGSLWARSAEWKLMTEAKPEWKEKRRVLFGEVGERFPVEARLFELAADPAETENLIGQRQDFPREVRELAAELRPLPLPGLGAEGGAVLDEETAKNLRALGYLQ